MATTKKSTKAKIKTQAVKTRSSTAASVKKPAVKVTKAARTVKKSVSTKAVKTIPAKKTSASRTTRSRVSVLQQLQLMSAVLSIGLAVAAGLLMSSRAYQLVTGLVTKDELASQVNTVFAPALHSVYDLELKWAVVGIMVLSAVLPLIYLLRGRKSDEATLYNRLHFWRWLEFGVITGLMVEVVALLSGIQDVLTLKLLGGVIVISSVLRWLAEKQQTENSSSRRSSSALSIITCLLPGLVIGGYAMGTYVYGLVRSPWYVYALYATLVVSFFACVINLGASVKRAQTSTTTQRNYMVLGMLTKAAFAIILIYGLRK